MSRFLIAYTAFSPVHGPLNERVWMPAASLDEAFLKVKAAVEAIGWEFIGAMLLDA